jgi:hypothetical protein
MRQSLIRRFVIFFRAKNQGKCSVESRRLEMRNALTGVIAGLTAVLVLCSMATAQTSQPQKGISEGSIWTYEGRNRSVGAGGPAPIRDLSGSWAGPLSGAGARPAKPADEPSFTPLGQKLFSANKTLQKYNPAGTNDPVVRTCDPLGFPRADKYSIMEMAFGTMPSRIVVLYAFQQQWREIWMDGRELPKNVGAPVKDAPDPRYYGYSVGHWESDNTLVVETIGMDDRTWLNELGYPHSGDAHVEERFTRTDFNDLELTLTIDDPKIYTKPLSLGTEYFRWIPNQVMEERLCVPSNVIEYLKAVGDPAGAAKP